MWIRRPRGGLKQTGLLKNAEELELKDKELMEAHLALKAQEMVVTQLQSTLANLFGQQSASNTTVAGELNSLLTIASQLLVVANQTAAGVVPSPVEPPPSNASEPDPPTEGPSPPPQAAKPPPLNRGRKDGLLEHTASRDARGRPSENGRVPPPRQSMRGQDLGIRVSGKDHTEQSRKKEKPVSQGSLDDLQKKLENVKSQIQGLSKSMGDAPARFHKGKDDRGS